MKRALMGMALVVGLLSSTGCNLLDRNKNCNSCNGNLGCRPCNLGWQRGGTDYQRFLGHNGSHAAHGPVGAQGAGGAPSAQVAYPYYTVRGPRDFLAAEPASIGR
ncbi:MAG: hypothetical protein KDA45_17130, partial [Planctomycetales bacterium]|nr:hypothetical protein [Planctomycetales bacterium]